MNKLKLLGVLSLAVAVAACSEDGSKSSDSKPAADETVEGVAAGKTTTPTGDGVGAGAGEAVKPRLDTAKAQKLLSLAAAEGNKPDGNCKTIIEAVNTAAAVVGPSSEENQQAFLFAAICAERLENYPVMLWAAAALAEKNPESLKLGIIPRALMKLDQPQKALAVLKEIDAKYPNAPGVLFAAMLLAKDQNAWNKVLELATPTVTALAKSQFKGIAWQAEAMRAQALLTTAHFKEFAASIEQAQKLGAPPPLLAKLGQRLIPVKKTGIYVDPDIPDDIYLGTYHLHGSAKQVGEMFNITIANLTGQDQSLKVEVEIPGVTDRVTRTVNLLKGGHQQVDLTPPLKADFKPATQQAERKAQVQVRVSRDGTPVFEESIDTRLFPRDQLPLRHLDRIPAWVTPQAPEVEALLTAAKKRAPGGNLGGSYEPTVPQIKALYDELKARGMSYVLVTNFGLGNAQHVRMPADTIKSTNALCLDGTVLFATLAEKIGLRPVMVRVPGHIFFGWHAGKADKAPPGTIFFLETTMVGSQPFETAVRAGQGQFLQQKKIGGFKSGQAQILDVIELRKAGITPQPWG